jgi:hypothetical protein
MREANHRKKIFMISLKCECKKIELIEAEDRMVVGGKE